MDSQEETRNDAAVKAADMFLDRLIEIMLTQVEHEEASAQR